MGWNNIVYRQKNLKTKKLETEEMKRASDIGGNGAKTERVESDLRIDELEISASRKLGKHRVAIHHRYFRVEDKE